MARSPGKAERPCPFCAIAAGTAPAHRVFEDAVSLAFLDLHPLVHGHCLLVPKAHVPTLDDLPAGLVGPLFTTAQRLSRALQAGLAADGSFTAVNTRISQSVPHLHIHVVPRRHKDGLFARGSFVWKRQPYADEQQMVEMAAKVAKAMTEQVE